MATPHVSGAVAFAAMNFPKDTVANRVKRVLDSVDVVSRAFRGKCVPMVASTCTKTGGCRQ